MGTRFHTDTRDPAVNVTNFVLLVVILLGVLVRLGTKFRLFKRFTPDDYCIVSSLVFCVVQCISVSMAVGSGYGDHYKTVSSANFDQVMKWLYAATILYYPSLCFSKFALVEFIRGLTPSSGDQLLARIVEGLTGAWTLVAVFGTAFQCSPPRTWDFWSGKCFDMTAWHYYVCISNIVTELLIVVQGVILIFRVQASLKKRLVVASIFAPRGLSVSQSRSRPASGTNRCFLRTRVVAAIIAELVLTHTTANTTDPTYDLTLVTILQQVVQCLSVVTACWGQLKPFLTWLKSNGLRIQDVEYTNTYATYGKSDVRSQTQSRSRGQDDAPDTFPLNDPNQILVTQDWEVDSQSSRAQIIREETHPWAEGARRSGEQSP
ncbi:uncharacterized protein N7459_003508 [Penicillium hispanicum]|uniref:uncharacterized protein n=1 Tax=Penicillium hispanicum TaxID=1080232 RepID=UPI0025426343|nr:uncharacterized protein N7459_003508 [Penicillium hispanicum]KAJ5587743.1 hypothetical protein N7459_003508 [Penicillium hispanicum]